MLEPAQEVWGLEIAEVEANSLQRCPEHREFAMPSCKSLWPFTQKPWGRRGEGLRQFVAGRGGQQEGWQPKPRLPPLHPATPPTK